MESAGELQSQSMALQQIKHTWKTKRSKYQGVGLAVLIPFPFALCPRLPFEPRRAEFQSFNENHLQIRLAQVPFFQHMPRGAVMVPLYF